MRTHAETLGRPLVTACKDQLAETAATGLFEREFMQGRLTPGKNLVFSTAFPLVWEQVARVGGSPILMQYDPPICVGMQGDKDYSADLEAPAWFSSGNYGSTGGLAMAREGLSKHFRGAAAPMLLPETVDPEHLFAYSYLFKHLPYSEQKNDVAHIAGGVRAEDFILDLPLTSQDDRLIVASILPSDTLAETVERALMPKAPFTSSGVPATWALERYHVPRIHFDFTWKFRSTSARYVLKMDETGVTMLSEAAQMALPLPPIIVARPGGAAPFPILVVLTKRSARRPYFAAWIESAELLIPDPTD